MPTTRHTSQARTVAVIGAGTIGASWVSFFLSKGLTVKVCDSDPAGRHRTHEAIAAAWPALTELGLDRSASPDNWTFSTDLQEAVSGCGFVQESLPERIELKGEVLRRLGEITEARVIIASSTSGLAMSLLQQGCRHPERYVVGHPVHPPHLTPAVEVVGGNETSAETIDAAIAFYRSLGKMPIHVRKEVPGYVISRLQSALWREVLNLVQRGVATIEDIDMAIANGPGLRWALNGPGAVHHMAGGEGGIDYFMRHLHPAMQNWWPDLGEPEVDASFVDDVVSQVKDEVGSEPAIEMTRKRDEALVRILKARRGYGNYGDEA
ncbi:MAG: 3-hydroxyacyl-CoA dehydrogenase [Rhodobiaceae bacterium]|nr:3-hydroxyacyl-CoA dehydrogenase [Rhodobiaceae bacterium]MCC0056226.1 3-hydroxyacyl-CoA dehydrogenase [Rhodobiaceae bacterium]